MTWAVVSTWNPPGTPTSPGGPGSSPGGGWLDQAGSTWYGNGTNAEVAAYFAVGAGPDHLLIRPSSESAIDGQIKVTFVYEEGTDGPILYARASGTPGSTFQAYGAFVASALIIVGSALAGVFSGSVLNSASIPFTVGHSYTVTLSVVQTGTNSTTVTALVTDNTTSTTYPPCVGVDTTPSALQGAVGVCAIQDHRVNSGTTQDAFTNLVTYTDAVAATGYSVTGPAAGAPLTVSTPFTVQSGGILASSVRVTPSDNAAGGTFTPAFVTLAAGTNTSATFTYTPAGKVAQITFVNNGALTNPAALYYASPTWVGVSSGTVSGGPTSPGAPGSVVWNGWLDVLGVWHIDSSQQLQVAYSATAFPLQVIQRPPQEATLDIKDAITFNVLDVASNQTLIFFDCRRTVSKSNQLTAYTVGTGTGALVISSLVNGSATTLALEPLAAFVMGHSLTLTVSVIQVSPTSTLISASLFDNTASVPLGSVSISDATSALQNFASVSTIHQYQGAMGSPANPPTALATYTDLGAATTYAVSGPAVAAPGVASAPFTVAATGSLAGSATITPSDGGAGGTFSPTSVTLTAGAFPRYATFTYTAAANGNTALSFTNTGGLTNPPPLTLQVYTLANVLVTSPAFRWSPFNWKGDTGRGGSAWRQSWTSGAYVTFQWTASAFPVASLLVNQSNPSSTNLLTISMNDQWTGAIPATGPIDLTLLSGFVPGAPNTCVIYLQASAFASRWNNGVNTVRIAGVSIDATSTAGVAAPNPPETAVPTIGTVYWPGDSLIEGAFADNGAANALTAWPFFVMQALAKLGYEWGISAASSNGWLHTGDNDGDVPAWYYVNNGVYNPALSRSTLIDAGVSILDANGQISAYGGTGQAPDIIINPLGGNEASFLLSPSDMQTSIVQWLLTTRGQAPKAKIFICVMFSMECTLPQCTFVYQPIYAQTVRAAYAEYLQINPSDTETFLLDLGQAVALRLETNGSPLQYLNTSHWLTAGHAFVAPLALDFIQSKLTATPIVPAPNEYVGKSASMPG